MQAITEYKNENNAIKKLKFIKKQNNITQFYYVCKKCKQYFIERVNKKQNFILAPKLNNTSKKILFSKIKNGV